MIGSLQRRPPSRRQAGLLLIGALVFLSLSALTAVHTGQRWFDARQRAAEEDLLFIGEQYRQAIESYWREAPNNVRRLPASVEELLSDNRYPFPKRHLRKVFRDPLAPQQALAEIRDGPVLIGVYSRSEGTPFRQSGFDGAQRAFNGAKSYADWKFVFVAPAVPKPARGEPPGARPPRNKPSPASVARGFSTSGYRRLPA